MLCLAITAKISPSLHDFIYFLNSIVLLMEGLFFIDLILLLSYTWALSGFLWLTLFSFFLSHYGIVLQDKKIQNIRLNLVVEAEIFNLFVLSKKLGLGKMVSLRKGKVKVSISRRRHNFVSNALSVISMKFIFLWLWSIIL